MLEPDRAELLEQLACSPQQPNGPLAKRVARNAPPINQSHSHKRFAANKALFVALGACTCFHLAKFHALRAGPATSRDLLVTYLMLCNHKLRAFCFRSPGEDNDNGTNPSSYGVLKERVFTYFSLYSHFVALCILSVASHNNRWLQSRCDSQRRVQPLRYRAHVRYERTVNHQAAPLPGVPTKALT